MFNFLKRKKRIKARILDTKMFNQEISQEKKTALVTFSAAWCGACKMQKPLIHNIAHTHTESDIIIGMVDTDTETTLSQSFHIQSIPTTIGFQSGDIIFRHSGLLSRRDLENVIEELKKPIQ
jgi:thioredoxin 1